MVAAKKKNTDELRICIDPRDLNQALIRPHHALKTVDDILSDVFSKLDPKSGILAHLTRRKIKLLHHVQHSLRLLPLHPDALRYHLWIRSLSTRYRTAYRRITLQDYCRRYFNVYGKTRKEHDRILEQVM